MIAACGGKCHCVEGSKALAACASPKGVDAYTIPHGPSAHIPSCSSRLLRHHLFRLCATQERPCLHCQGQRQAISTGARLEARLDEPQLASGVARTSAQNHTAKLGSGREPASSAQLICHKVGCRGSMASLGWFPARGGDFPEQAPVQESPASSDSRPTPTVLGGKRRLSSQCRGLRTTSRSTSIQERPELPCCARPRKAPRCTPCHPLPPLPGCPPTDRLAPCRIGRSVGEHFVASARKLALGSAHSEVGDEIICSPTILL